MGDAAPRPHPDVIAALLLAAGESRRFGGQKLLHVLDGKPVVRWSAECLVGAVDEIVVVVGGADNAKVREALEGLTVRFVDNAGNFRGMASSLACGVAALTMDTEAVLVALGDEPMASRKALDNVIARYRAGGAQIVAPMFRGVRGHPVLFDRAIFPELLALSGDHGARAVTDRDQSRLAVVPLDLPKPVDVDTPADLARLRPA